MTDMQTVELSNDAKRMRRYRKRKRQGVVCIAMVPIYALDVETLVARSRLEPDNQNNVAKISTAIEAIVDDFTEGKFGPLIGHG